MFENRTPCDQCNILMSSTVSTCYAWYGMAMCLHLMAFVCGFAKYHLYSVMMG